MTATLSKKIIPATTVICKTITATLSTIIHDIGSIPMDLEDEISKQKLNPTGPSIFVYINCTNDPKLPFQLTICQPIETPSDYSGTLDLKTLAEFSCVEKTYTGSMDTLGSNGWEPLMGSIMKDQTDITNEMREVYTEWVSLESEENIIELQVGLE